MIISKKQVKNLLIDYTKIIYQNCGRKLSKRDEIVYSKKLEKAMKENTICYKLTKKIKTLFKKN